MKPIVCVITFALGASAPVVTSAPNQSGSARRSAREEAPTSQDQSNTPADIKTTKAIRQALVKDASLSSSAKNVKVITVDGTVTLRGSVKSADEKAQLLETARKNAAGANFDDRLEIGAKR
jgi:hyperosmotically inducible periplasmic protein